MGVCAFGQWGAKVNACDRDALPDNDYCVIHADYRRNLVKFKEGDRVVVTGDTAHAHHAFKAGTRGTIKQVDNETPPMFFVDSDDGASWWVDSQDLQPEGYSTPRTLNEQVLVAALKIVGVPDNQHDQIVRAYNTISEVLA